tara:strand:- start:3402 stop:3653 length:252 start_codon:yes stop_codon:yes gene_type:complete
MKGQSKMSEVTKVNLSDPGQTSIQYLNGVLADLLGSMPYSILPIDPETGKTFVEHADMVFEVVGADSLHQVRIDDAGKVILNQ